MPTEATTPEQRTAKRKTHRKSRNGCYQCKQRHSKCNETHPRCGNCMRLDIVCTWPSRSNAYSTATYPTPPESHGAIVPENGPVTTPDVPTASFGPEMSMADMRLLHHWTAKTYRDICPHLPAKWRTWQVDFVEIAFDFPFLLQGFLALAAVHKVLTEPKADRQTLLLQADRHISNALATYRQNLEQPSEETAIPMFLLSSTLVTYNLASAQLETPEDPINAVHQCFRLVQGVRVVMAPHWEQVISSKAFAEMAVSGGPLVHGDEEIKEILQLKELKKNTAGDTYASAIDALHQAFLRVRNCAPDQDQIGIAFSWTAALSDQFTHLISIHDPIAVLVLAHFAALLAQCCQSWWVREWPQRIVFAAQKLLMATPELLSYLDWPLQIISAKT